MLKDKRDEVPKGVFSQESVNSTVWQQV
jgi:hypothetical protein